MTLDPSTFNRAAFNLGLPLRWQGGSSMTADNLNGWDCLAQSGFVNGHPNDFLRRLIGHVEWMDRDGRRYQESLRDIEAVEGRVVVAAGNYAANVSSPEHREAYRVALRDRDLATRAWADVEVDFSHLPLPDQRAIKILLDEAAPHIERIYWAQMDPLNLRYLEEIIERGAPQDLYAFRQMAGVRPLSDGMHPLCSPHPDSPGPTPNQGFCPPDMSVDDIRTLFRSSLADLPNVGALASPFVWIDRAPGGQALVARGLSTYPPIRKDLDLLVAALRKAAAVEGIDPSMTLFLQTRANELTDTLNPFPFFAGDAAWVALRGAWDLIVGFYEESDGPVKPVASMEMALGAVDPRMDALARTAQRLLPWMEDQYAAHLGANYKRRDFRGVAPLRFISGVFAGDAQARYVPVACNLPNVAPYGQRDLSKKVFFLTSTLARFDGVIFPMARLTMDPAQRARIQSLDALPFIVGHENAHAAGPGSYYVVRTQGGADITASATLKEHSSALEEARADMLGIASLPEMVRQGLISPDEAERAAICFVAYLNRDLALGEEDEHGKGGFVEFTTLVELGGIVETAGGRYAASLDNGRIFTACEEIGNRINRIQMTGDYDEYDAWYRHSVRDLPRRMAAFLPTLQRMPKDILPQYKFRFS